MAIIAHGHSRKTKDIDIWLDPLDSVRAWADAIVGVAETFPRHRFWSLAERSDLAPGELEREAAIYGVLRVSGFDRDIDIFRAPNRLDLADFDRVWREAAGELAGGVRLANEIDLYMSKMDTEREQDWHDMLFLESKIKARFRARLPVCDLAEATSLLERFVDPDVLGQARTNPHPEVRRLCRQYLREFAAEGDPYSRDILAAWQELD